MPDTEPHSDHPLRNPRYFLGCHGWSCPHWRGSVFAARTAKAKWLACYSQTFNTVEGNSSFYGIPTPEMFARWAAETQPDFRFAMKFPRIISHDKRMQNAEDETRQFLAGLEIMQQADRLGPSFLQLPPRFSPDGFSILESYLKSLPQAFPIAVEVRHPDWFRDAAQSRLNELLQQLNMDRVIFDSRPLYSAPPATDAEQVAQTRKPKVPLHTSVTAHHPLLRLIGRDQVSATQPWIDEWVPIVAGWIAEGKQPYIFSHTPADRFGHEFARLFHNSLAQQIPGLMPLTKWPFEQPVQQNLF